MEHGMMTCHDALARWDHGTGHGKWARQGLSRDSPGRHRRGPVGVRPGGGKRRRARGVRRGSGAHPSGQGRRKKREGKDGRKGVGPCPAGPPRWGVDLETVFKMRVRSRV
jgi:hypothetical protein